MALIGYARTSTAHQNLDAQLEALEAFGCDPIRAEQASGRSRTARPELDAILAFIREGDSLVVTRVDRLARSVKDLQDIAAIVRERGAALVATEQPVDTSTAAGKAFFDMLGVFAEFENNIRRERQMEGIASAKARGVYKGRAPNQKLRREVAAALARGVRPVDIVREVGCARSTVYAIKQEIETKDS